MFKSIDHPVLRLIRTRIGNLVDHKLQSGEWRLLDAMELLDFESGIISNEGDLGVEAEN